MTNQYARAGGIASALVFAIAASAAAAPITLTQTYSDDGRTISGTLHGDKSGDLITLNNSAPLSTLSIALPDPDPIPHPSKTWNAGCIGYSCRTTMNLNGSTDISLDDWLFDMRGSIDLAAQTGELTGTPTGDGQFATLSATVTPTFSVAAQQIYGPINQAIANAQAAAATTALNVANFTITFSGSGTWDSIDMPNISAVLSEDGDTSELDFRIIDAVLSGNFTYTVGMTFDNSIVDLVGNTFISLLRDQIYALTDDAIMGEFTSVDDSDYRCEADRISRGNIDVDCTVSANFLWSDITQQNPAPISTPAMAGLFGLGLVGLIAARRRRSV